MLCVLSSACIATRWTFPGPQMVGASYNPDRIWPGGEKYTRSLLVSRQGRLSHFGFPFHASWSLLCFSASIASNSAVLAVHSHHLSPLTLRCLCCLILRADSGRAAGCAETLQRARGRLRCWCKFGCLGWDSSSC